MEIKTEIKISLSNKYGTSERNRTKTVVNLLSGQSYSMSHESGLTCLNAAMRLDLTMAVPVELKIKLKSSLNLTSTSSRYMFSFQLKK